MNLKTDGIRAFGTLSYRYAYPDGVQENHASKWSHIDEQEVRDELWDVQPGDTVYDLGSAFGSYALNALARGAAIAHCFNPSPTEVNVLRASTTLNGWQSRLIQYQFGLWSKTGFLSDEDQIFTQEPGEFRTGTTADGKPTQFFPVVTLDHLEPPMPVGHRAIMKMDVEGAEVEVLKGAQRFMATVRPALVVIERHDFKDPNLKPKLDEAMSFHGYELKVERPYHAVTHCLYVPR